VAAQIVIWTFYDQFGQSEKGVGGARVCALDHCNIAKWSRVAKCVNILQDNFGDGYSDHFHLLNETWV
jgi:hypothetical protein